MSIFSKLLGRKTVNKISREFRKALSIHEIVDIVRELPLPDQLLLQNLIQAAYLEAGGALEYHDPAGRVMARITSTDNVPTLTYTSYETARGIDRHILHEEDGA